MDSATLHELGGRWHKAGAPVELFTRNSLVWMEAREEADAARRAYERRLHTMSKEERPE